MRRGHGTWQQRGRGWGRGLQGEDWGLRRDGVRRLVRNEAEGSPRRGDGNRSLLHGVYNVYLSTART